MQRIPCFKVQGSKVGSDLRPPLFVHLDGETVELRRDGTQSLDVLCTQFTLDEARDFIAALNEILPPRSKKDDKFP